MTGDAGSINFWRFPSRRRATRSPKQRGEREASPPRRDGASSPQPFFENEEPPRGGSRLEWAADGRPQLP